MNYFILIINLYCLTNQICYLHLKTHSLAVYFYPSRATKKSLERTRTCSMEAPLNVLPMSY